MSPTVSALIPCYQMADRVAGAVRSVLAQEGDALEIVVVDDGSTDDPAAALRPFGDRVKFLREENRGVSAARNAAARASSGEWLAFLDADDRWLPHKTRRTLEGLERAPAARFAYGQARGRSDDGRSALLGRPDGVPHRDGPILVPLLLSGNLVPMLTGFVHRSAFDAVGGLDETLRTGEDYDFWIRLAERFDAAYVDEPVAEYRMHEGGDVMGDVERWGAAIERIHAGVAARHRDRPDVLDALAIADARMRLARGWNRLVKGDRTGARADLDAAARCPRNGSEARRLRRWTHVPAPIYRALRTAWGWTPAGR